MLTITDALHAQAATATQKVDSLRTPARFLVAGVLGGVYLGIGVVLMVSAAGPLVVAGDGLAKLVAGGVFGVALTLVVFAGADLATSAMMFLPQGVLMRTTGIGPATLTLVAVFAANLLGALAFGALILGSGLLRVESPGGAMVAAMLETKAAESPLELFIRDVLCTVLVCLAIWMGARVRSEVARIILIFAAITAFVTSSFEHVIANMALYSIGLALGDPNASVSLFAGNLLWVGLGNLIGGGLIVGAGYWVLGGRPQVGGSAERRSTSTEIAA